MQFYKPLSLRLVSIMACLLLIGCALPSNTITYSGSSAPATNVPASESQAIYPKTVQIGETAVTIHPPQITSWENFETIEGIAVIEAAPGDEGEARFGVVSFIADAVPDLEARTVAVDNLRIISITENDEELSGEARAMFTAAFSEAKVIPLDLVLSHLADDVISTSTPDIISQPPQIFLSQSSAVLLLLHGEPVLAPIDGLDLQFVANTNWSLFLDGASDTWYLRNDDTWLQAANYAGPWSWAGELPFALRNLPEDGNWRSTRNAATQWHDAPNFRVPDVFVSTTPAELILLVGDANLINIGAGLAYVNNTDSQLFKFADNWYYLVSGRWFVSDSLQGGWQGTTDLPAAFAAIPTDHVMADVLASVPGTPEAKIAVLDAQIPKKTSLPIDTQLPETVTYTGEPEFVPINGTTLMRAANTSFDVIQVGDEFYLCYSGTWYDSDSANGPWSVASSVPAEMYSIPASDPAYKVTYVNVVEATPTTVTYSYTSGYSNVYFYFGVAVWGSGWYYPPYSYYYGGYPYYYHYPITYGSGSFYNPRTGAYGSVGRAYGPYGGYGYASGFNPSTGTYGRAESVWDYDEWYGVGEAYNPGNGNYFGTERYYDADDGDWKVNSTLQTQLGDVDISRRFDADSGTAQIRTGAGGEGTFTRRASDGGWDTSGQFTTADGRTITSAGRFEDGRGTANFLGSDGGTGSIDRIGGVGAATRQGTFTRDGQTLTTNTTRDGLSSRTRLETSAGGQAVIGGTGLESRTGIGQSSSGDIYATRDGNVYRRSDSGWEQRSGGQWSGVDSSSLDRNNAGAARSQSGNNRAPNRTSTQRQSVTNRNQSLNRQYQARQRGMGNYSQYRNIPRGGLGGIRRR